MEHAIATAERPAIDTAMRRLLRVPELAPGIDGEAAARSAFSRSILVSAVRCLLTYIVLPFVAPAVGWATGVGPVIGLVIGVAAIACNIASMRRFWAADHRWRWAYTGIAVSVMCLVTVLMVEDLIDLLS